MKKQYKRTLALILAALLWAGTACPALAAESTPKEEVVYASLDGSGAVEAVYVVNIFDLAQAGTITDYGAYSALRNMTGTGDILYEGDTVTIQAEAGKLYYEGTLENPQLPWLFEIHYYLDGAEYTAADLAGRSGALEITLSIRENTACAGDFFQGYALQISLTLDTALCSDITAEGATIANVGGDKQLTYTVLPGSEKDFTITASVTDFVMDSIAINGVPLSLDVEVDDEELLEQVTSLMEAIEALDDGAGELDGGVGELQTSVETELASGTGSLAAGASALESGTGALAAGAEEVNDGAAALAEGAETLQEGLETLNQGAAQLQAGLETLNSQSGALTAGSAQVKAALAALQSALDQVNISAGELETLVTASGQIQAALEQLTAGAEALSESVSYAGYKTVMAYYGVDIDTLVTGNAEAATTIQSLLSAIGNLVDTKIAIINVALESMGISMTVEDGIALANQLITLLTGDNAALSGVERYLDGVAVNLETLYQGAAALQEQYAAFDQAIGSLTETLSSLAEQAALLAAAVDALAAEYATLDGGIGDYTVGVAQVLAGYEQLAVGIAALTEGSGALSDGASALYSGTGELLAGIVSIYEATGSLTDGAGRLDSGVAALLEGIRALYSGTGELKEGTAAMREETEGMDEAVQEKIDALLESVTGGDIEITSFVSAKNTSVEAVQFVITIPAIKTAEAPAAETVQEEETGFWQKLLDLF